MYEINFKFVDDTIKRDTSICDPTFDNGFFSYVTESKELKLINTDCIKYASVRPIGEDT